MVQSTGLISIEAVFIVLKQFELVTRDFSMKTANFIKNAHAVMGSMTLHMYNSAITYLLCVKLEHVFF
jgi:hypothetical protein